MLRADDRSLIYDKVSMSRMGHHADFLRGQKSDRKPIGQVGAALAMFGIGPRLLGGTRIA